MLIYVGQIIEIAGVLENPPTISFLFEVFSYESDFSMSSTFKLVYL